MVNCGTPHCPDGLLLLADLLIYVEELIEKAVGKRMIILAPWMKAKASVLREEIENLERRGFQRLRINGVIKRLDDHDLIPLGTEGGKSA